MQGNLAGMSSSHCCRRQHRGAERAPIDDRGLALSSSQHYSGWAPEAPSLHHRRPVIVV